ncbi:hypothetical protein [Pseudomonas phage PA1C]|nr:hypothetical protein [Pseudomonas phage PA1C]
MRQISISLTDNPIGASPLVGLYKAINAKYSSLGLTQANSRVIRVQPAATKERPNQTVVFIQKGTSYDTIYDFYYDRFNLNDFIENPYWTASEVEELQQMENSTEVLGEVARKSTLNLTKSDIWVNDTSIDYTGGQVGPNWLLKSIYNSLYFTGELVLWLHSGGDGPGPEPEPIDGFYEHIFEGSISNYITGTFGNPGYYVSLSVQQNGNRVYVLEPIPEGEKVPTLNWPTYHENDPATLVPGHEWIIINNSGHEITFDPEGLSHNKFLLPAWNVIAVKQGGTIRGTAIGWDNNTNQWIWAISGDIVQGKTVGSSIMDDLISWYAMEGIATDSHGGHNFGFNSESTIPGKVGQALSGIKASGAEGNFGSYNSGTAMFGWFKVNNPTVSQEYVLTLGKFGEYYGCKYGLSYRGSNGWRGFSRNAANTETTVSTGGQHMGKGEWQFIVLQVKDRFLEIYVDNGNPIRKEIPLPSSGSYDGLQFGEIFSDSKFDGAVDEVGLCWRPLEKEEIAWLYNNGQGRTYETLV